MGTYVASSNTQTWTQQTGAAQWVGRNGAALAVYNSAALGKEILTMAGGFNGTGASNDVSRRSDKQTYQCTHSQPALVVADIACCLSPVVCQLGVE